MPRYEYEPFPQPAPATRAKPKIRGRQCQAPTSPWTHSNKKGSIENAILCCHFCAVCSPDCPPARLLSTVGLHVCLPVMRNISFKCCKPFDKTERNQSRALNRAYTEWVFSQWSSNNVIWVVRSIAQHWFKKNADFSYSFSVCLF